MVQISLKASSAPTVRLAAVQKLPKIWFHPPDPVGRRIAYHKKDPEFAKLFASDEQWENVANHINVFKFYSRYILQTPETELRREFSWLARHRISIAVEMAILAVNPRDGCGNGVEGFGGPEWARSIALKIRSAGGSLAFVAADEPLFFGHDFSGPHACRTPIPELAAQAARTTAYLRSIFPAVQFVDIEPISNFKKSGWVGAVKDWLQAYERASGQPFTAFFMDVAWWQKGWQSKVLSLIATLKSIQQPIGIIYDGDEKAETNEQWLLQTRQHWKSYESLIKLPPDYVLFQSWHQQPSKFVPESYPNTFTNLILKYIRDH